MLYDNSVQIAVFDISMKNGESIYKEEKKKVPLLGRRGSFNGRLNHNVDDMRWTSVQRRREQHQRKDSSRLPNFAWKHRGITSIPTIQIRENFLIMEIRWIEFRLPMPRESCMQVAQARTCPNLWLNVLNASIKMYSERHFESSKGF